MKVKKIPKSLRKCETYKRFLCRVVRDKYGNVIKGIINNSGRPIIINGPIAIWGQKTVLSKPSAFGKLYASKLLDSIKVSSCDSVEQILLEEI